MNNLLSISIPVCDFPSKVLQFVIGNEEILGKYDCVVINRQGGEELRFLAEKYIQSGCDFWTARLIALNYIKTKYVLNLDVDTILPDGYIERAIQWLEECPKVGIVWINYQNPHGQTHPAFGTSIMRTADMRKLYDYTPLHYGKGDPCECLYMKEKILNADLGTVLLDLKALHLREKYK